MLRQDIIAMLERLSSPEAEGAWDEFVTTHARFILQVVKIFERDEEQISDAFVHVCTRLRADDYRRLRQFDPSGPAQFKTWLCIISRNLYLDWRRTKTGRQRPFRFVSELPRLEREIYRRVFEEGRTRSEALGVLAREFPELTEAGLSDAVDRLHASLTPRQRWFLAARRPRIRSLAADDPDGRGAIDPRDPLPDPESTFAATETWTRVQTAMERLEPEARLLIQLRYEQELSLKEVAALLGLANPQAAGRKVETAIEALRELMEITESKES